MKNKYCFEKRQSIILVFAILTFYYFPHCKMVFYLISNENNLTLTNEYVKFCTKQGEVTYEARYKEDCKTILISMHFLTVLIYGSNYK